MSYHHPFSDKPKAWKDYCHGTLSPWVMAYMWMEHKMEWLAYLLGNWKLVTVLGYLESFGVLIAVIFYFAESGDRLKQKHYQAWQVINSAQGKGGNGGRIEAVEELNADGIPLVGVDLSSAFLVGVQLPRANLARSDFSGADVREGVFLGATLDNANLRNANFRHVNLTGSSLQYSDLTESDFTEANLTRTDFYGAYLDHADLKDAEMRDLKWQDIKSIHGANITGVKHPPLGFVEWALKHGAIESKD